MVGRLVSPVTVGRRAEIEAAVAALDRALAARPVHLLVAGEAGVGKSRLLGDLAELARSRGMRVLRGECANLGEGGLPYAPIVEALRDLAASLDPAEMAEVVGSAGADLGRLVPALAPGAVAAPIQQEWLQARLLEALLGLLRRLAARTPLLLVVEDLHWADPATRETVSFLVRNVRSETLLIAMTFRSDELHRRHPLLPWLAELERTGRVGRIDLARLDLEEMRELVTAILGAEPEPSVVRRVHRRSDGNPFFAEELLAADGEPTGRGMSATLREVLLAHVAAAPDEAQSLVAIAAVAGRRIDHDLLAAVAERSETDLLESLRTAVSRHLLVSEVGPGGDDGYAFRHALLREVVYEELLPGERRRLHRACAEALARRRVPTGASAAAHWAELAHHWANARNDERAFEAFLRAADADERTFAFETALHQYQRALDLWPEVADPEAVAGVDRAEILARASRAAYLAGIPNSAVALQREAIAAADPAADPARVAVMHAKLGRVLWFAVDTPAALTASEAGVAMLRDLPPSLERATVLASHGQLLMLLDRVDESRLLCEEAISIAMEIGAKEIEGHARNTLGMDLIDQGRCAEGIASLERALEIAVEAGNVDDIGRAYVGLTSGSQIAAELEAAADVAEAGIRAADAIGISGTYGAFIRHNAILVNFELGRWDRAADLEREVDIAHSEQLALRYGLVRWIPLLVASGDFEQAHVQLDRLAEQLEGTPPEAQFHGAYYEARTELALWEGRPRDGLMAAERGLALLAEAEWPWYRLRLHLVAARAAADTAEVARARRDGAAERAALDAGATLRAACEALVERVLPGQSGAQAAETRAMAATVMAEERRLVGSGDPAAWADAVERWRAGRRPYLLAYARWRHAESLLAAGERSAAAEALREADRIAERLGAGPLRAAITSLARRSRIELAATDDVPASEAVEPPGDPFGLTPREREVLGLVALGRTNRQIAGQLFISENTAGVHVSNILGKLGAASRAEAAAIAVRAGLATSPEPDPA